MTDYEDENELGLKDVCDTTEAEYKELVRSMAIEIYIERRQMVTPEKAFVLAEEFYEEAFRRGY